MSPEIQVFELLDELDIDYQIVEHPPAFTTEEANQYIVGIPGVRTKTMFLTDKKKKHFYLVIMDDARPLDMERFREIVGANKIKMASEDSLYDKLQLTSGSVSPFGLLNNSDHDVEVFIEATISEEERMSFHPNMNEMTIFIDTADLLTFFDHLEYEVQVVDL